ncbi:immunoglobulin-like domain-containing protein [Paenibacillus rigui]|uniref:SLH domain-containing protein n=1 Tax=Paenibacillus rigui TaxID=554312 RepID=A0A229UUS9_9BACL|nr:immunoglobulin-like domain-containing protein [Paenibacillus rigui]OXM87130.1 hypothetical protein CF651_05605 [Paenibacillus rigui]
MSQSRILKRGIALVLAASLTIPFIPALPVKAADPAPQVVTIDANAVDTNPVNTFKGYGAVSANNTSRLLLDYKEEHPDQYWQIMNLLFNQDTGAGITHIKVEMGNDSNTSSGTEPATKRSADEPANVRRGAGFVFAADAKKINPNIKVSILRWTEPNWVQPWSDGNSADPTLPATQAAYERLYKWYKETAIALKDTYGYTLDYINPDRNETSTPNVNFIKWFANRMHQDSDFPNYDKIKIVASDENTTLNIPDRMLADADLMKAVDVMAYHYNMATSANYVKVNQDNQKEVWYSEGVAPQTWSQYRVNYDQPFGGPGSALDVAGRFIGMYTQGKRTHYMFQPAVSAFYSGGQYSSKELVSAKDPWSGHYTIDVGVNTVQHFTQFAAKDWLYSNASAAVIGNRGNSEMDGNATGAEYNRLVLISPDKKDFSGVLVNDSDRVASFQFDVKNNIVNSGSPAQVWETRGPDNGQEYDANWYQRLADITPVPNGTLDGYTYNLTVKPHSMVSLTSTVNNPNTDHPRTPYTRNNTIPAQSVLDVPGSNPALLYEDDFEYSGYPTVDGLSYLARRGGTPRYTNDQGGAFEVYEGIGKDGSNGLRQMIHSGIKPGTWATTPFSFTVLGDERWTNYAASIDFKMDMDPTRTGENYVALGVRHKLQGTTADSESGYKFRVYADGTWRLIRETTTLTSGSLTGFDPKVWHRFSVKAVNNIITASLDDKVITNYLDNGSTGTLLSGQVMLQTSLRTSVFDNLKVEAVNGYAPYAKERVDDLDSRVAYHEGNFPWSHSVSGGYARIHRTLTTSGATITPMSNLTKVEGTLNRWYLVRNDGNTLAWSSNTANAWAGDNGSYASLTFNGTGVTVYGIGQGSGSVARMDVYLDDFGKGYNHDVSKRVATNVAYAGNTSSQVIYQVNGLAPGTHTVKIVKTGAASGSGNTMSIEKAVVTPSSDSNELTYLQLPFTGTGFSLLGDTATVTLDVYVDGTSVGSNVVIPAVTGKRTESYSYSGLPNGPHTLRLMVKSGSFSVDAIDILGDIYGNVTKTALSDLIAKVSSYQEVDYIAADWTAFTNALNTAQALLANPSATQSAIDLATNSLQTAVDSMRLKKQPVALTGTIPAVVATKVGSSVAGLPTTVKVTLADGTTDADANIVWQNNTADRFTVPYSAVQVKGEIVGGKNLYVTVQAEVIPEGLVYFLDPGISTSTVTSSYTAVKNLAGTDLLNDKADQLTSSDTVWGHTNAAASYSYKGLGGSIVETDKSQTGVYTANTKDTPLVYVLPLKAGKYTITSFHRDWWNISNRTMDVSLSYVDADGNTVTKTIKTGMIAGTDGVTVAYDFDLPLDATVKYKINNTYAQAALISYLGVAKRTAIAADLQAVSNAKTIMETATYSVNKATANTEADVKSWLQQTFANLNGMSATGVTIGDLAMTSFQAATDSINGSFAFTAALAKGEAQGTAAVVGTITTSDTTKPVITLTGNATVNVTVGASYTDAGATATDNVDSDITSRIVTTITSNGNPVAAVDTSVPGTYTYHYNVSDAAGNAAEEITRTVHVLAGPDTVKPVITLIGDATVNLAIGAGYTDAGVKAVDDHDGDITNRTVTTITYNGNLTSSISTVVQATYIYHYNVSDTAGNAANEVIRTVNVTAAPVMDTVKPVITLNGDATVQLIAGATYADVGASAMDDRDGSITDHIVTTITKNGTVVTAIDTSSAGTYTYHYNVRDAAGNAADEVTRTVVVAAVVNNNNKGNKHNSSSSTVPSVTTTPQQPTSTQMLSKDDLKATTAGQFTAQITDGKDSVLLPSNVLEIIGDKSLHLVQKDVTINISNEVLKNIQTAVSGDQAQGARIYISAAVASKDEVKDVLNKSGLNGSVHFSPASEMYDLAVHVVTADGAKVAVTTLVDPVVVTFRIDPKADPDLLGVYEVGSNGTLYYRGGTLETDGTMTAKVDRLNQYVVLEYNKQFTDVKETFWANDVITKMAAKHVIEGVTDAEFNPHGNVTRAEYSAMIARALGLEPAAASGSSFKDVGTNDWYSGVVAVLTQAGIVTGRSTDSFEPNANITREEMAVIAAHAYEFATGKKASPGKESTFADSNQISAWAQNSVGIAQEIGLLKGRDNNQFAPQEKMTRAESAQVMFNLLKSMKQK